MDFFQYASAVAYFNVDLWVQLLVGGLCFAIVFIFEAVALFVIASREKYPRKWMAFIPFFNTYYIGVCAQKNKFYNIDAKKIGLVTAVFEAVLVAGYIVYNVACFKLQDYISYTPYTDNWGYTRYAESLSDDLPAALGWAKWMYNYLGTILSVAELLFILCQVCLLSCFFQTYACRRSWLFTLTSILFPIQGILFFVVRNNKAMNYRDYIKNEQARRYRIYQQQQQQYFYQNPYNQNPYSGNYGDRNPYQDAQYGDAQNRQTNGGVSPEDPFGDLGNSGNANPPKEPPFDEFH